MILPEPDTDHTAGEPLQTLRAFIPGADRRGFLTSALLAIGITGAALSGCTTMATGKATSASRFLDPARYAALDAVSETIMPRTDTPGARDALVPERFDALMQNWASASTREKFSALLDEADALSRAQTGSTLAALPPEKQLEVVTAFDKAKFADAGYRKFKNLILALYYVSEPGATQELRYEHVPGAWEPSIPVTADTRAWAIDISL